MVCQFAWTFVGATFLPRPFGTTVDVLRTSIIVDSKILLKRLDTVPAAKRLMTFTVSVAMFKHLCEDLGFSVPVCRKVYDVTAISKVILY